MTRERDERADTQVPGTGTAPSSGPATMSESWPSSSGTSGLAGPAALRYRVGEVLGRGGMGEVLSARDDQIGRSVAIKRLRAADPSPTVLARFLREAKIQGRLEHPAVVPVHELWHDDSGRPFFVMKQVAGVTLFDVLGRLRARDPDAVRAFSRQRLLRAFAEVCLAIEFAHTRGVVHRDLKPGNIVLGDFGEVYVLDWGVARVLGDDDAGTTFSDIDTADGTETVAGAILGTPGYIAPEQIRGAADLDGRADVYSLGCILFEILAVDRLYEKGQGALAQALAGGDARPSVRAPDRDIPPELDLMCVRATALDAADRYATARQLGDAVQLFLDGDRDVALRRDIVDAELAVARAAIASGSGPLQRRAAIRAAARALALDPTAREPADLIGRLMLEPPAQVPPEVLAELDQLDYAALKKSARFGTLAAVAYLCFLPILYWIGFRDVRYLITGVALCTYIIIVETVVGPRNAYWSGYLAIAGHLLMIALFSRLTTPVMIGVGPATVMVMLLSYHRKLIATWLIAVLAGLATVTPWLLELAGVLSPVSEVRGSDLVLHTGAARLDPVATVVGIVIYYVAVLLLSVILSRSEDDERRAVRAKLQTQAWQLRQLVPS